MRHPEMFTNLTIPYLELPDLKKVHEITEKNSYRVQLPANGNSRLWLEVMFKEAGITQMNPNAAFAYSTNETHSMYIKNNEAHTDTPIQLPEYPLQDAMQSIAKETWINKDILPERLENYDNSKPKIVVEVDRYSPMFVLFLMCSRDLYCDAVCDLMGMIPDSLQNIWAKQNDPVYITHSAIKDRWGKGLKTSYYGKEFQIVKLSDLISIEALPQETTRTDYPDCTKQDLKQLINDFGVKENVLYDGVIGLKPDQFERCTFMLRNITAEDTEICFQDNEGSNSVLYSELTNFRIKQKVTNKNRYLV